MGQGIVLAIPFVVVLGGTLLLAVRFGINAESFFHYIEKLTHAGNRDRALKLCVAAGHLPVAQVVRAGLVMRLPGRFADEDALADAAIDTLLPEAEAQSRRFMPLSAIALLGIGGAVAIPFLSEVDAWVRIVAAIALVAASANLVRLAFKIRRDVYAAVGVVAPLVRGDLVEEPRREEE